MVDLEKKELFSDGVQTSKIVTKANKVISADKRYCQHCNGILISGEYFTCSECGKHSCFYCDHSGRDLNHFRCFKCDRPIKRTLEATLSAKDIRKLKQDGIFIKQVFITKLVLKYTKRKHTKRKKRIK